MPLGAQVFCGSLATSFCRYAAPPSCADAASPWHWHHLQAFGRDLGCRTVCLSRSGLSPHRRLCTTRRVACMPPDARTARPRPQRRRRQRSAWLSLRHLQWWLSLPCWGRALAASGARRVRAVPPRGSWGSLFGDSETNPRRMPPTSLTMATTRHSGSGTGTTSPRLSLSGGARKPGEE